MLRGAGRESGSTGPGRGQVLAIGVGERYIFNLEAGGPPTRR